MAHNDTEIGTLLKQGKEEQAANALLALLEEHGGNVVHASIAISVNRATVKRWLARLEASGWDVREQVQVMREQGDGPEPMNADELEAAQQRVREEREVARCLAWLQKATPAQMEEVAIKAGVELGAVTKLHQGHPTGPAASAKIMVTISGRLERQRKAWRERRRAKSMNQG